MYLQLSIYNPFISGPNHFHSLVKSHFLAYASVYKHIWVIVTGSAISTVPVTILWWGDQLIGQQKMFLAILGVSLSLNIHEENKIHTLDTITKIFH